MEISFRKKKPELVIGQTRSTEVGDFYQTLGETLKDGGAYVEVHRRKRSQGAPDHEARIEGADAYSQLSFETYLQETFGDGIYLCKIYNKDRKFVREYEFRCGDVKELKGKADSDDTEKKAKAGKSASLEPVVIALINANAERDKAIMEYMQQNKNGMDTAKVIEMLQTAQRNSFDQAMQVLSAGGDPVEQLERWLTVSKMIPSIQPEENILNSLVHALPGVAAAVAQLKTGYQQPMGQVPQALPPGQTQVQLTPQQLQAQAYAQQLQTGQTQAQLSGTQQQPQITPQPQTPPQDISKSSNERHRGFYYMFIDPLRHAITNGESDSDIAYHILDMMEYSVHSMRKDPHPLVAGMVRTIDNPIALYAELFKFFDTIPELAGLKEKQASIHANIVEIYTGSQANDADNADLGDADQQDGEGDSGEIKELKDDPSQLP